MTRPAENQQTVEALAQRVERLIDKYTGAPWQQRAYAAGTLGAFESGQDARAALRDLAAQASRTREWKQLAEDMGEALRGLQGYSRELGLRSSSTDALLARLHDLAAEQDAA